MVRVWPRSITEIDHGVGERVAGASLRGVAGSSVPLAHSSYKPKAPSISNDDYTKSGLVVELM